MVELHDDSCLRPLLKCKIEFFKAKKVENLFKGMVQSLHLHLNKSRPQAPALSKQEKTPVDNTNDEFTFIRSLYELARFDSSKFELHKSRVPFKPRAEMRERKVVICHDIAAGINEEKNT